MNLLKDPWIPVLRQGGSREVIAPWQLTDRIETDPIIAVASVRPDFDNALLQFLIGLLQTVMAPVDDYEWGDRYDTPPAPSALHSHLIPWSASFEFLGEGPRFLQDIDQLEGKAKPISALLMESPGDQTIELNRDHFQKRDLVEGLCDRCTATALFTLQTNAPSGGKGHRTSLRGGGPLTILVVPTDRDLPSLWSAVWANVLPLSAFPAGASSPTASLLPWLGPTRASDTGLTTTPTDVHALQAYWGMPRRIRLEAPSADEHACSLCGEVAPRFQTYVTRPYGVHYAGAWRHPLSPYRRDTDGLPICLHPGEEGLGYRDWPRYVFGDLADGLPAMVVHAAVTSGPRYRRLGQRPRMHVSGYDMDNMKARCWYETTMPAFALDEDRHTDFSAEIQGLVEAAVKVTENLTKAVRDAWFDSRPGHRGPDTSFLRRDFLIATEPVFFEEVSNVHDRYLGFMGNGEPVGPRWHRALCRAALEQFDLIVGSASIEHEDPKKYAKARAHLIRSNSGKPIRNLLGVV